MNITDAKYIRDTLTDEKKIISATINGEKIFVPKESANRHYQAILEWVKEGNKIQEAD